MRRSSHSFLPKRATPQSAGLDLCAVKSGIILPGERRFVSTGLKFALPKNTFARICGRSSLAKSGIDVGAGILDSDYRGTVKVLLINNSKSGFLYSNGDKIAQVIIEQLNLYLPIETKQLDRTERGKKGFGSSGYNIVDKKQ